MFHVSLAQVLEPGGGFQTARARLSAELRAKGQSYVPQRPPPGAELPVQAGPANGGSGLQGPSGAARLATRAVLAGRGGGAGGYILSPLFGD